MRNRLLLLLLLAASPAAGAFTLSFSGGATIAIDDRWYVMLAGNLVVEPGQGYVLQAPVGISGCARPNAQAQTVTTRPLRFNNAVDVVYLTPQNNRDGTSGPQILAPFDRPLLRFTSATGDIVCNGEVPPPPGLDTVFRSGFE
jgi:hypothetical protein